MLFAYRPSVGYVTIFERIKTGDTATFAARAAVMENGDIYLWEGSKSNLKPYYKKLADEWPGLEPVITQITTTPPTEASLDPVFHEHAAHDPVFGLQLSVYYEFFQKLMAVRLILAQYQGEAVDTRVTPERSLALYSKLGDFMLLGQAGDIFRQDKEYFATHFRQRLHLERFWDMGYKIYFRNWAYAPAAECLVKGLEVEETTERLRCLIRAASLGGDQARVAHACVRLGQKTRLSDQEMAYMGVAFARLARFEQAQKVQHALGARQTKNGNRLAARLGQMIQQLSHAAAE